MHRAALEGRELGLDLGGKVNQTTAATRTSSAQNPYTAIRTPNGRNVCGSATGSGSEAAGMDVRGQDAPGAEVVRARP